jgi:hypothetical protein
MSTTLPRELLHLTEIPCVERLTVAEFRAHFLSRNRPVRIRGAIESWPAIGRWSPDDFRDRYGDAVVDCYEMAGGQIRLDPKLGFRLVRLCLREYVDKVVAGGAPWCYLRARLPDALPEIAREVGTPVYCAEGHLLRKNLWFSGKGTISHLHFDLPHNLIAQVYGKKKFYLFSPGEAKNLYPHSWLSSTPHLARVDLEQPDPLRFPRLRAARGHVGTIEPGDLLFIPSRWWHHANSVEVSISVNFWWASPAMYPFVRASDLYKSLRGLNI